MCLFVCVCSVVLHTSFVYCFVVIDNVMELQSRELCGVNFDDDDVFVFLLLTIKQNIYADNVYFHLIWIHSNDIM